MRTDGRKAQEKAKGTGAWAVTMTKVRIRQVASRARWQLITFCGPAGGESRGVVDMLAVRKDHGEPIAGTKRGDALQIILIQVKGGAAAMPTDEDAARLRAVARRAHARYILLAVWRKGFAVRFFKHRTSAGKAHWSVLAELEPIFR